MHEGILNKADAAHTELLAAYKEHNEQRARFHALLGINTDEPLLRKYGPMAIKYLTAGTGGAGILAGIQNFLGLG